MVNKQTSMPKVQREDDEEEIVLVEEQVQASSMDVEEDSIEPAFTEVVHSDQDEEMDKPQLQLQPQPLNVTVVTNTNVASVQSVPVQSPTISSEVSSFGVNPPLERKATSYINVSTLISFLLTELVPALNAGESTLMRAPIFM